MRRGVMKIVSFLISVTAVILLCGVQDTIHRYLGEELLITVQVYGFFLMVLTVSVLLLVYSVSQMILIGVEAQRRHFQSHTGESNSDR